jgi:hypothetical protein
MVHMVTALGPLSAKTLSPDLVVWLLQAVLLTQVLVRRLHNLVQPRLIVLRAQVIAWTVCLEVFLAVARLLVLALDANQALHPMQSLPLVSIAQLGNSRRRQAMAHAPHVISTVAMERRERHLAPVRLDISLQMAVRLVWLVLLAQTIRLRLATRSVLYVTKKVVLALLSLLRVLACPGTPQVMRAWLALLVSLANTRLLLVMDLVLIVTPTAALVLLLVLSVLARQAIYRRMDSVWNAHYVPKVLSRMLAMRLHVLHVKMVNTLLLLDKHALFVTSIPQDVQVQVPVLAPLVIFLMQAMVWNAQNVRWARLKQQAMNLHAAHVILIHMQQLLDKLHAQGVMPTLQVALLLFLAPAKVDTFQRTAIVHYALFALLVLLRAPVMRELVLHAEQILTHRWLARSVALAAILTPLDVHLQLPEYVPTAFSHLMVTASVVLHAH